jgi:hypothetical protein
MTEAEWLTATDPKPMLDFIGRRTNDRKLRLFACACCRRVWHVMPDEACRTAVDVAEQFADGVADRDELIAVLVGIESQGGYREDRAYRAATAAWHAAAASLARRDVAYFAAYHSAEADESAGEVVRLAIANLLREVFGNPFRPVTFSPEWRTDTAIALAKQMYDSRDFGAMPILADALQDAGCDNDDILNHCRDANTTHVRGCWVVDMVLDKA